LSGPEKNKRDHDRPARKDARVLATPDAHPRRRARFFFEVVAMRRSGLFAKKNIERE
jgi:hypothetical protein